MEQFLPARLVRVLLFCIRLQWSIDLFSQPLNLWWVRQTFSIWKKDPKQNTQVTLLVCDWMESIFCSLFVMICLLTVSKNHKSVVPNLLLSNNTEIQSIPFEAISLNFTVLNFPSVKILLYIFDSLNKPYTENCPGSNHKCVAVVFFSLKKTNPNKHYLVSPLWYEWLYLAKEQNPVFPCFSDFTTGTHSTWEWCHSQLQLPRGNWTHHYIYSPARTS